MTRSDLIRQVAQHLEPWAWETKSFNATMARDDAMFKAEQIVDLFGSTPATLDNTAVEGPCTDCHDTGITGQTERACSCAAGDTYRTAKTEKAE